MKSIELDNRRGHCLFSHQIRVLFLFFRALNGKALPYLLCVIFSGCTSLVTPPTLLEDLEKGRIDAHHVIFICEGMFKDLGAPWDKNLQEDLQKSGATGLYLSYFTGISGVWFNYGSIGPGNLVADTADRITQRHKESGSPRDPIIDAVGFSHGCEVILRAACLIEKAKFRRVVFINSSSLSTSSDPDRLVHEGKIQKLRNYWSPMDVVTLFAPLGAGQFGLCKSGEKITNERTCITHLAFLIGAKFRSEIISYLREDSQPLRGITKFNHDLVDLLG